jgi:Protein of unknown function (DUF1566)
MKRWSRLTTILVAAGCLMAGARPSSAQGPYYPLPAWDQKLPANTRFVRVLFEEACANNVCAQVAQGVLDRETGLVWERSPSSLLVQGLGGARGIRASRTHGNRQGWRVPSLDDLYSLVDPTITSGISIPAGHPFLDVSIDDYWTSTDGYPGYAYPLGLVQGGNHSQVPNEVLEAHLVWCVRGGAK